MAPSNDKGPNGWTQWSKHVLMELERLNRCYESLDEKMQKLRDEVTVLQVKAWMAAGVISAVMSIIVGVIVKYAGGN